MSLDIPEGILGISAKRPRLISLEKRDGVRG